MKFLFLLLGFLSLSGCGPKNKVEQTQAVPAGVAPRVVSRPIQAYPLVNFFEPNTDENDVRLFVVGQLFDGVSQSVANPRGAPSQDYQEFRMDRWYLVSPFKAVIDTDSPDLSEKFKVVTRTRLEKSDFKEEIDGLDSVIKELHRSGI